MSPWVALALDVLILVCLVLTITYAVALNHRLGLIRHGRAELEALVGRLGEAVQRAEKAIQALRAATLAAGDDLGSEVRRARELAEEMRIITEAANGLADRMERAAAAGRRSEPAEPPPRPAAAVKAPTRPGAPGRAAESGAREAAGSRLASSATAPSPPAPAQSSAPQTHAPQTHAPLRAPARSRAERELAEAIENMNRGEG